MADKKDKKTSKKKPAKKAAKKSRRKSAAKKVEHDQPMMPEETEEVEPTTVAGPAVVSPAKIPEVKKSSKKSSDKKYNTGKFSPDEILHLEYWVELFLTGVLSKEKALKKACGILHDRIEKDVKTIFDGIQVFFTEKGIDRKKRMFCEPEVRKIIRARGLEMPVLDEYNRYRPVHVQFLMFASIPEVEKYLKSFIEK